MPLCTYLTSSRFLLRDRRRGAPEVVRAGLADRKVLEQVAVQEDRVNDARAADEEEAAGLKGEEEVKKT